MKILVLIWCFLCVFEAFPASDFNILAGAFSSSSSLLDMFSGKGDVNVEEVMISIESDKMNQGGAVKLHLLIVYEEALVAILEKMNSDEYFRRVEQLKRDHPDKMIIFEWNLVAKKRALPWTKLSEKYLEYHMTPLAGFVFVSYSTNGDHRARVPIGEKIQIILDENDFELISART